MQGTVPEPRFHVFLEATPRSCTLRLVNFEVNASNESGRDGHVPTFDESAREKVHTQDTRLLGILVRRDEIRSTQCFRRQKRARQRIMVRIIVLAAAEDRGQLDGCTNRWWLRPGPL